MTSRSSRARARSPGRSTAASRSSPPASKTPWRGETSSSSIATPEEVRAATGYPVGGVPPIGHGLPVLFDEALLRHERIWAAGGDSNSLFEVDPRELIECVSAEVVPLGAGA